jgi:hypothetical protein
MVFDARALIVVSFERAGSERPKVSRDQEVTMVQASSDVT